MAGFGTSDVVSLPAEERGVYGRFGEQGYGRQGESWQGRSRQKWHRLRPVHGKRPSQPGCMLPGAFIGRPASRRFALRRRFLDGNLLSRGRMLGEGAQARKLHVLQNCCRGRSGGVSALSEMPPRACAGNSDCARHRPCGCTRRCKHAGAARGCSHRSDCRGARHVGASSAPLV